MPGYNIQNQSAVPIMSGMLQQGELQIKILQANMYRNTDWFKQMDPYVVLEFQGHQFRTKILNHAGKHPIWNESFTIHVNSMNDEIRLIVMDKDFGKPDDVVGSTNIKVSSLCFNNGSQDWFILDYKQKQAGQILLESTFYPSNVPNQGAPSLQYAPPPVMNVQPQDYRNHETQSPPKHHWFHHEHRPHHKSHYETKPINEPTSQKDTKKNSHDSSIGVIPLYMMMTAAMMPSSHKQIQHCYQLYTYAQL
eukprot:403359458